MNLSELLYEVGELRAPNGDRLRSDYKRFINRAQRTIASRRNWTFMKDVNDYVMAAGTTSIEMPFEFKCLQIQRSPITYTNPETNFPLPVTVKTRAELERLGMAVTGYYPYPTGAKPLRFCYMENSGPGGNITLNIPPQNTPSSDLTFHVSGFFYPSDLVQANDHNRLTDDPELADALVNLTKALAYFALNPTDVNGLACQQLATDRINLASAQDAHRNISGMSIHM